MTYNQLIKTLTTLLESHPQIKSVKNRPPSDWLERGSQPEYSIALFTMNDGAFNAGGEDVFNVVFWFLDKSGMEAEFEDEVISDQLQIARDIKNLLLVGSNPYFIDEPILFTTLADKYEDYIAGVTMTVSIHATSNINSCDIV